MHRVEVGVAHCPCDKLYRWHYRGAVCQVDGTGSILPILKKSQHKGCHVPGEKQSQKKTWPSISWKIIQEPYRWPSVANVSRLVLGIRYSLLPYYYTLFYKAHRSVDHLNPPAATVTRPLFFEFPTDQNTYSIDTQFLVGSGILISPQLNIGKKSLYIGVSGVLHTVCEMCRWPEQVCVGLFPSGQVVRLVHTSGRVSEWTRNQDSWHASDCYPCRL